MYAMFSFTGIYACLFGWSWQSLLQQGSVRCSKQWKCLFSSACIPRRIQNPGHTPWGGSVQFWEWDRAQGPARIVLSKQKFLEDPDWPITIQELSQPISASCLCCVKPLLVVCPHGRTPSSGGESSTPGKEVLHFILFHLWITQVGFSRGFLLLGESLSSQVTVDKNLFVLNAQHLSRFLVGEEREIPGAVAPCFTLVPTSPSLLPFSWATQSASAAGAVKAVSQTPF